MFTKHFSDTVSSAEGGRPGIQALDVDSISQDEHLLKAGALKPVLALRTQGGDMSAVCHMWRVAAALTMLRLFPSLPLPHFCILSSSSLRWVSLVVRAEGRSGNKSRQNTVSSLARHFVYQALSDSAEQTRHQPLYECFICYSYSWCRATLSSSALTPRT